MIGFGQLAILAKINTLFHIHHCLTTRTHQVSHSICCYILMINPSFVTMSASWPDFFLIILARHLKDERSAKMQQRRNCS